MTEADFTFLRDFLRRRSGLNLGPEKRYLVESRLGPLRRSAGLGELGDLVGALRAGGDEMLAQSVVDAMATHETLFFRDGAPFDALRDTILPRLANARPSGRPLRVWSAAASTGQEAYSVAMLVHDMGASLAGRPVQIVGTDMSDWAIRRARAGLYSQLEVQRGMPIRLLLRHFTQREGHWEISRELREAVEFRVCNLLGSVAALGTFDVILCRNLLIYLDLATKERLLATLSRALAPDGALCLGGAESAVGLSRTLVPDPEVRGFFVRGEVEPWAMRSHLAVATRPVA